MLRLATHLRWICERPHAIEDVLRDSHMRRIASALILSLSFTACADAHNHHDDAAEKAVGYYLPGSVAPDSADLSRGDVPRDNYGRPYTYEGLGEKLPLLTGQMADGTAFTSDALEGRWTVIEAWGIWCHDSRRDAPYAAALATALNDEPTVDFMSVHTPQNAARAKKALRGHASVSAWFDEKGWAFPTLIDEDASLRDALKIRWTPTYLVIAPDLTVQGFRTGLADAGETAVEDFVADIAATQQNWAAP